jgi:hypothetical protein
VSVATCAQCGRPLDPGARFCGQCGHPVGAPAVTAGAGAVPVATIVVGPPAPVAPVATGAMAAAYPVWSGAGTIPGQRPVTTRVPVWAVVLGICIVAVIAAGLIGWIIGQGLQEPCVGPDCGPLSPPLGAALPYTSSKFGYSLDASGRCKSIEMPVTSSDEASIGWTLRYKGLPVAEWPLDVRGQAADARSAQEIVEGIRAAKYADAQFVYSIPMAELGYAPGYGAVYDLRVGAGSANPIHARAIVIAAVKGDLAITLDVVGPFDAKRVGHPFPVQTHSAICFSPVVSSLTWPGESPP